jgi:WXG100 family type VII secretion target
MPNFKSTDVDSRQIDNIAVNISDDINELLSIRSELESNVIANLGPYWQGQAKERFESQFNAWFVTFSKLVNGYMELNEQLKKAGIVYGRADDTARQLIAKMPG